MMDLVEKCKELKLGVPVNLIGRTMDFISPRGGRIFGQIIGVGTTHDGLPELEVSNHRFAGFEVKSILVNDVISIMVSEWSATLFTTCEDPDYRSYPGQLRIFF